MTASSLDPRVNAYRPDVAAASLRGYVKADRYVDPLPRQCVRGVAPLLVAPHERAGRISEIRYGEVLDVLEERPDGYAWVQNRADRYVGYLYAKDTLSEEIAFFATRVTALHTFVYAEPSLKSVVLDRLTLGSYVRIVAESDLFFEIAGGGYVFCRHVAPAEQAQTADYVFTAGRMLGAPYLWGGRTPLGLDCSALVQLALDFAGIEAPRDSDQQREIFGRQLPMPWRDIAWRRGDLVFFAGHVGIMTGYDHMIHANAFAMQVTVEPLVDVVARGASILSAGRPY